jgi:hypothetical protein
MAELQTFCGTVLESGDETRSRLLAAPREEELIPTALELAQEVLRATVVGLALVRPERAGLHVELSSSDGRLGRAAVAGLARQAMKASEALLDPFPLADRSPVEGEGMPAGSVLAFPLKARGALLGALVLWREQVLAPFTLSVVVERHKGSLSFDSEEGKGTTFYVRLPVEPGEHSEGDSADLVSNSSTHSIASGV